MVEGFEVANLEENENLDISEVIMLTFEILIIMNQTIDNSTNIYSGLLVDELLNRRVTTQDDLVQWITETCIHNIAYYQDGIPNFYDYREDHAFGVPENEQQLYRISFPLGDFIKDALKLEQNKSIKLPASMCKNRVTIKEVKRILLEIFNNDKDKYYCKKTNLKGMTSYYKEVIMLGDSELSHKDIFNAQAITKKQLLRCIEPHLFLNDCYKTSNCQGNDAEDNDVEDPPPLSSIWFDNKKVTLIFMNNEIANLPLIDMTDRTDVYKPETSLPRAEEEPELDLNQASGLEAYLGEFAEKGNDDDSSNNSLSGIPPLEE